MKEMIVIVQFTTLKAIVDFTILNILQQIRCAVIVEEDSKWIWEPLNKLGNLRPLRTVTRIIAIKRWMRNNVTCAAYYNMDKSLCGSADRVRYDKFIASQFCCACGGGETRICENTDNGRTNMIGASCIDLAVANSYGLSVMNHEACNQFMDTMMFTSSVMCCACGGGITISPDEEARVNTSLQVLTPRETPVPHYRKYSLGVG